MNKDKINESILKDKFEKYGITNKSMYSIFGIVSCIVLVIVLSLVQVQFNPEFYKDIQYWISLTILIGISIVGMQTGGQISDDVNRNKPNSSFRVALAKYRKSYENMDNKKLLIYFSDWLEQHREKKLKRKIESTLKDEGIYQMEVLDLDLEELDNLNKSWAKDWTGTNFYDKYYNVEKNKSITYFMSYNERQIAVIYACKTGRVKVSKLSTSFFVDALNVYEKDMWESSAHSTRKRNSYLGINRGYKILSLIAISALMSGLEPIANGDISFASFMLSFASRMFCLTTSLLWGAYINYEIVKIDISYLDYKTVMLNLYTQECEEKIFVPKSIEERAKEQYLIEHIYKEDVDENGQQQSDRNEETNNDILS